MKKIFAIIALFALVFTSCQKDETMFIGSGLDTITATIESTNGTKATLDGSYNVVWSEDDEISVFVEVGESVYNVLYTLSSVNSNGTGVFTKTSDHDISGGTIKAAFYPYTENARYENGTITGVYTVVQGTYSTTPTAARMAAKVESGTNISFKNIGAIVKVTTPNIPTTYSAVQLYSATSYLSGDCSVSFEDDGTPVATPAATDSRKFVTFIGIDTQEAQAGETQSFYFPIFAGNYSDLTVVAKGGQSYDQELVLIAPKSLTAERSKLYYTSASVKTVTTGVVTLSKVQGSEEQNIEIATEDDQISVATEGSEPVSGKVNISINTNEEKELTITLPDATVLLSGKTTYSSITASTAENTLILGNGVTVTNVTVKKGNVQVNAGATLNGITLDGVSSVVVIDNGGNIDDVVKENKSVIIRTLDEHGLLTVAKKGGSYTLTNDVTLSETLVIEQPVIINGNGRTLTSITGKTYKDDRAINIKTNGEVKIKNLKVITEGERAFNVITYPSTLTLDNVNATSGNYTVNIATSASNNSTGTENAPKVFIKNSTLKGKNTVNINGKYVNVDIIGSNIICEDNSTAVTNDFGAISISEGSHNNVTIDDNTTINITEGSDSYAGQNLGDETCVINFPQNSTYEVKNMSAKVLYGNYAAGFKTLQAAINFAESGNTIALTKNVIFDQTVTIAQDKNITIDLGGKTITIDAKDEATTATDFNNLGTLTIKNGNIVANNKENSRRCIYNHGTMEIDNVTFTQTYNQKGAAINNEGIMTIKDATVNTAYYGIWNSGQSSKLTIEKGTYTSTSRQENGEFAYLVNNQNGASLHVKGGTFTGIHGVIGTRDGADVDIDGGTFTATKTIGEVSGTSYYCLWIYNPNPNNIIYVTLDNCTLDATTSTYNTAIYKGYKAAQSDHVSFIKGENVTINATTHIKDDSNYEGQ